MDCYRWIAVVNEVAYEIVYVQRAVHEHGANSQY